MGFECGAESEVVRTMRRLGDDGMCKVFERGKDGRKYG